MNVAPRRRATLIVAALAVAVIVPTHADVGSCVARELEQAPDSLSVGQIRELCAAPEEPASPVEQRLTLERYSRDNPFVLTSHRPNYVMPLTYVRLPRREGALDDDSIELQFQLSQKVLLVDGLIGRHGQLSAAYTNRSFWQAYDDDASSPFRETNHEPELLLGFENDWKVFGFRNVFNQLSLNHQSNGRSGSESRSWNRIILNAVFERENFVFSLRPWYRIPEAPKTSEEDTRGDDNPDIERYIGRLEWIGGWTRGKNLYSVMLRNNLERDNRGAIELSWSFPIHRNIKASVRYFNGYGESLINYDRWSESLGIGFLITDWL